MCNFPSFFIPCTSISFFFFLSQKETIVTKSSGSFFTFNLGTQIMSVHAGLSTYHV